MLFVLRFLEPLVDNRRIGRQRDAVQIVDIDNQLDEGCLHPACSRVGPPRRHSADQPYRSLSHVDSSCDFIFAQDGLGTWDEFLKIHAATLWQCDFFSKKVLTPKGLRDLFVLVFLHVETRRVFMSPATYHPNESWVTGQAAAFVQHAKQAGLEADTVMHDRDCKSSAAFDDRLKQAGLRVTKSAFRSPNTVAYVERVVQSIQQECLDYYFVFGERHMNYLCAQSVEHYHTERPHQGRDNELLMPPKQKRKSRCDCDLPSLGEIRCQSRLGGLLKHYYRQAA